MHGALRAVKVVQAGEGHGQCLFSPLFRSKEWAVTPKSMVWFAYILTFGFKEWAVRIVYNKQSAPKVRRGLPMISLLAGDNFGCRIKKEIFHDGPILETGFVKGLKNSLNY